MDRALMEAELTRDECRRHDRYLDSEGIPTTGIGHNLNASPLPLAWSFPLTDDQIDQLFEHDLAVVLAALDLHLPWWRGLSEVRQRVLVNMCFNLGISRLMGFARALGAMQTGAYLAASNEMRGSIWFGQVGLRAQRLCTAMAIDWMPQ